MALFNTFFFVFSLRLGAIIIGILTLLKSSVWLIFQIWGLECLPELSDLLKDVLQNQSIYDEVAKCLDLYENLKYYVIAQAVFYFLEIIICILLLMGAYQCQLKFIYPFCWSYIFYLILVCLDMSLIYRIMKKHYESLGFTILYFSIVVFVLVYCVYVWLCIYSLIDVIKTVQCQVLQKVKSQGLKPVSSAPQVKKIRFKNIQVKNIGF